MATTSSATSVRYRPSPDDPVRPTPSGARLRVRYRIAGNEHEARARALGLCLEQTVELPHEVVPSAVIEADIVGRIESMSADPSGTSHLAEVSYAIETFTQPDANDLAKTRVEITQLLNVLFGNSSIQPGLRVERIEPSPVLGFPLGPKFGLAGLRELCDVRRGPLLCTALKPMGLSAQQLGNLTEQFALGGIHIIKDDHGLSDQPFAPFEQRLEACARAIERAYRQTGRRTLYAPNVTGDFETMRRRARLATQAGAGALLVSPGLCGFAGLLDLARDPLIDLPILVHPALLGSFVTSDSSGISHAALFGQIVRLAGGDATIFPSYGGRFAFTRTQCEDICRAALEPYCGLPPIAPVPAGGIKVERLAELMGVYGDEVVLLIGGALLGMGADVTENARLLRTTMEQMVAKRIS